MKNVNSCTFYLVILTGGRFYKRPGTGINRLMSYSEIGPEITFRTLLLNRKPQMPSSVMVMLKRER